MHRRVIGPSSLSPSATPALHPSPLPTGRISLFSEVVGRRAKTMPGQIGNGAVASCALCMRPPGSRK